MSTLSLWSRWDSPDTEPKNITSLRTIEKLLSDAIEAPRTVLFEKRVNAFDPSFYDCVYSIADSSETITERCYRDIGCCASGCCTNTEWQEKYGWAVALICMFSLVVITTVICWMGIWLCNRRKDKNQRKELLKFGSSSSVSNMSFAYPIANGHYHFGTGPFQSPPLNYPTKY
ncbi:unnamed protein product [Caenorhabditis sp. 36 PRJEB53466]|nr:unnamed protein product [Caenorhabditis sp. 36 PRJEB53466]